MGQIILVTGTDTGVGKTVLTALLTRHLRETGRNAMAMKPFCSGSRADARLLRAAQEKVLTLDEINPFFFGQPLAPAAASGRGKKVSLDAVVEKIRAISSRCELLLVEGAGGVLVPLGEDYTVADLIARLECPAVIVSRNRLGTINHTLMTVRMLQSVGVKYLAIGLVEEGRPDLSARSNAKMIQKMAPNVPIFAVPNLGPRASNQAVLKINVKFLKKTLARITRNAIFVAFFGETR